VSGLRRTTGVVLAGGRSRRFGSSDKLTASYGGEPMLHRSVRVLADLGAEVIVVLAPDVAEPSVPSGVQARFVRDTVRGQGPLAGVVAGLREVDSETALVVAGDMPELQVPVLRSMLRTLNEPGAEAVWLHDGDRPRPVPLAVRTAPALAAAQRLFAAGERRLRALPEALGARVLEEAV
jgi:molybdenum cofactor guanylyltransferase